MRLVRFVVGLVMMASTLAFADGAKQMALMCQGYKGTTTMPDFQALVKLPEGVEGFNYADYAAQDGSDIWFSDAEGNVIPHQIDTWDTTGESLVWVKIPEVASAKSYIVMHWGEARGEHVTTDPVWDGFIGVWHMGSASGSENEPDATGNGFNAVPTAGVLSGKTGDVSQMTVTDGVVGKARFNQTNKGKHNGLKVPDYSSKVTDPSRFSVSGWWRLTGQSDIYPRFIAQRPGTSSGAGKGWEIECASNSSTIINAIRAGNNSDKKIGPYTVADMSQNWIYLTVIYDGTTATLYVNGTILASGTLPINSASTEGCMIGNLGVRACGWYGKYDEIRLYDGIYSADRIQADYDTMTSPTTFLTSVDLSAILAATWTGTAGDRSLTNPENWKCINGYGNIVANALPTSDTVVYISGAVDIQVSAGQTLTCRSVSVGDCTLAADCDWRGLENVWYAGRLDLNGHTLIVSTLDGPGTITSPGNVPESVLTDSILWFDASEPTTLSYNPDGTLYSWLSKSSRYITNPLAIAYHNFTTQESNGPVLGEMPNGRPTVDFGAVGSGKDMRYTRFTNIRTVFLVTKIANTVDAFLLGDYSSGNGVYNFHRGPAGQYGNPEHAKFESVWNGENPVDWQSDYIPDNDFQIISIVTSQNCASDSLTSDRKNENRNGGRQLSEMIAFDAVLSDEDRLAVTRYLRKKWFDADPSGAAPGKLTIDAPADKSITNSTVTIVGNVKVVKTGAGTFLASKPSQAYYGGNEVQTGTFATTGDCSYYGVFNTVTVAKNATFDLFGSRNHNGPLFQLDGGSLISSRLHDDDGSALKNVKLTADSVMGGTRQASLAGLSGTPVTLDLDGYTLSINIASNQTIRMSKLTANGGGRIVADGGGFGWLQFGISGRTMTVDAKGVTLELLDTPLRTYAAVDIGDYVSSYTGEYDGMTGSRPVNVHGSFAPGAKWHECVMQNGSVLDLSGHTEPWSTACTFAESSVTRHVTFADDATITINAKGRKFQFWEQLVAWDAAPENLSTLTFQLDEETALDHGIVVRDNGIFVSSGTLIIVR
ncbi:MAG: DUF2341 domain-containing protein [Kiritimatiellae bacterium]|nr:DUF2341 domain-containing protein [Kiritimatiellia bacterium]